jgi:mannose-6-phosphate isomerase-like protein (cupin superfamily)
MLRFISGFAVALLISLPLSGQDIVMTGSAVHLNEHDVPWPASITVDEAGMPPELRERQQEMQRMREIMRWKTLIGTGGRFGEALPDRDIGFGVGEIGPGGIYPAHRHPCPELYYFISGRARWNVDGEIFIAEPGSTVYLKPNAVHSLEIISDEKAVIVWADWAPNGDQEAMQGGYELLGHVPLQPESARINRQ